MSHTDSLYFTKPNLTATTSSIKVSVDSEYLPEQSQPESALYVFAYHVRIENFGTTSAQLMSRHWIITDGNQEIEEIIGEGVIGEQPLIQPGEIYEYSSGAVIRTPVGSMHGNYRLIGKNGNFFDAYIDPFTLAKPHALH
jgi:ApaG protein